MHRQIAKVAHFAVDIVELGAGTLNHLQYEKHYDNYDIIEPYQDLYRNKHEKGRIRKVYSDISELEKNSSYDRFISIAVLEHLTDLPYVVAKAALHLRPDGIFQAAIPSEGGLSWGLAWRLTTGIAFRLRTRLSYAKLMQHEHVNPAEEIELICQLCFKKIRIKRLPLPSRHLSLYTYIECMEPTEDVCRELINYYLL
jgi:SAM-dependent methyltransferase